MTKSEAILDSALEVLRKGRTLTLDAVAQQAGLTKPGIIHHFSSKEALTVATANHLLDLWEKELTQRSGVNASPLEKLRAYIEFTLLGEMDAGDLALLADPKLRVKLSALWDEKMISWFGQVSDPNLLAARFIADGAWIDRGLGLAEATLEQRKSVLDIALSLIDRKQN